MQLAATQAGPTVCLESKQAGKCCHACPNGWFADSTKKSRCSMCPQGWWSTSARSTHYNIWDGPASCTVCPSGRYSSVTKTCDNGDPSNPTRSCPKCLACDQGMKPNSPPTKCISDGTDCSSGQYRNPSTQRCTACTVSCTTEYGFSGCPGTGDSDTACTLCPLECAQKGKHSVK